MIPGTAWLGLLTLVAQEPTRSDYDALLAGLIDLRWMCEEPLPGEGLDPLEAVAASGGVELQHLRGPGVIGRIWCSRADGTLLVYADGAGEPAVEWRLAEFAGRGEESPLPPEPLAGALGAGWYSMVPLPFQREIRVVWRPQDAGGPVRLQAEVRRLGQGAVAPSLSAALLEGARSEMQRVARTIADDAPPATPTRPNLTVAKAYFRKKTDPGAPHFNGTFYFPVTGDGLIRWFEITMPEVTDPAEVERQIRLLQLRIELKSKEPADRGKPLFEMPLGELMGSGFGWNPYDHYVMGVRADGRFVCRLPIPYQGHMQMIFLHPTKEGVRFQMRIAAEALPPEKVPPLRLRGGWLLGDATQSAALDVAGPARLVSYAWSSQCASEAPWELAPAFAFADHLAHPRSHGWTQVTRRDGPGWFGRATMLRLFGHDAPVAAAGERLRFEPAARYGGAPGEAAVSARALWYGPESTKDGFGATYEMEARLPAAPPAPTCFHVDGATEAESAKVLGSSAGAVLLVEDWSAKAPGASRRELLLLRPGGADGQVVLGFSAAIGGEYELVARYGRSPGFGRVQAFVEGRRAGEPVELEGTIGLSDEIVLERGTFLPREYKVAIRSLDGKPVALDYLRLRPAR